jgi:hypothetical protein
VGTIHDYIVSVSISLGHKYCSILGLRLSVSVCGWWGGIGGRREEHIYEPNIDLARSIASSYMPFFHFLSSVIWTATVA